MKTNIKILVLLLLGTFFTQCTSDFDKINVNPNGFTQSEVSAKFFLTPQQVNLFGSSRFAYWRANLIHADRYAGHVSFGFSGCWWNDGLGYSYNSGYTDAAWGWASGYIGGLENFQKLVRTGGDFENQYMDAMASIMRGIYFQMFTDIYGMVSYTEATNPDIVLPKLDDQKTIYKGIIAELDQAMATIGDAERTGASVNDAGENDLYYGGDLQKWKKLANTLKLRIAMRALGADGDDFAQGAISEALAAPLLETGAENALLKKDETISQWSSACYGDVYYNFGRGSDWKVGKTLIDKLRNFDDPRLPIFADPAPGGTVVLAQPEGDEAATHQKRVDFIKAELTAAGVDFTETVTDEGSEISFAPDTYYIGQPSRINGDTRAYSKFEFWSKPDDYIVGPKNADPLSPELILTSAEAFFLRAEAAVRGLSSENAQEMYQEGIRQSMELWTVSGSDIDAFMANSSMAQLDGTMEEMLEKIATQRWINAYTDGFEAWAIVRDTGYPSELAGGVDDYDIFAAGDINGDYPQRLRYGNRLINTNGANAASAISIQGPDQQDTKLWYAK